MNTKRSCLTLAVGTLAVYLAIPATQAHAARFGVWCDNSFQNNWQDALYYGWNLCNSFADELDDTDTKEFSYSLVGAKPYFEESSDQTHTEKVSLVWIHTHGGTNSGNARWAMWNQNTLANSSSMRYGDEGIGLSIMANYACKLLYNGDSGLSNRWVNAFKGGLRYVTGSHDTLYIGLTTIEAGEDFADELQSSQQVRFAWRDGISDWWEDQDIAVATMAKNAAGCINRLETLTWQNFNDYTRHVDGDVNNWCTSTWTNY